jgi:hypothetical protein
MNEIIDFESFIGFLYFRLQQQQVSNDDLLLAIKYSDALSHYEKSLGGFKF